MVLQGRVRAAVQFPALELGGPQQPIIPVQGIHSPISGLPGSWHAYGADIDNHAHMNIKNK